MKHKSYAMRKENRDYAKLSYSTNKGDAEEKLKYPQYTRFTRLGKAWPLTEFIRMIKTQDDDLMVSKSKYPRLF